jgi:hypothetical protein
LREHARTHDTIDGPSLTKPNLGLGSRNHLLNLNQSVLVGLSVVLTGGGADVQRIIGDVYGKRLARLANPANTAGGTAHDEGEVRNVLDHH